LLLPLRGFLGVTFVYAALQKLANPDYLDPTKHTSVAAQMRSLRHSSPIGPLLGLSLHAPALVGLCIAGAELLVGLAVLLGLFTRLAALVGMLLSLTFLLTVSWNTTPYYYGSDIVFFFAWTVFVGLGAGGVLALDARLGAADPAPDLQRRAVLGRLRAAGIVAVAAAAGGGLTAAIGRWVGGTKTHGRVDLTPPPPTTAPTPVPTSTASTTTSPAAAPGVAIGSVSQVPLREAGRFVDPASGQPAYVVHLPGNTFVAFSAVCTHAGCTVRFDSSSLEFVCPCHGGTYDASTGQVTGGPPPSPLAAIPVHIVDGQIRVDG
jgi:thiosulfate dehydrogenase [quinone] large subunit